MSQLVTDLSQSPYWDDYNAAKQFYRILFVPKKAVQVREMNQLQTIVQQQISRFGDHVFKDGSIVSGCNITHIPKLDFIRCSVYNNNNSNTQFTTEAIGEFLVVSQTTGLRASIQIANPGYVGTYPDTNVMYVNYLNKGRDSGNNEVTGFVAGETLAIYDASQDKFGALNPGLLYNTIPAFTPNASANQAAIGQSYAVTVGDGIVYQKGYFVNVLPHTILVNKYSTNTVGKLVGFQTKESIISYLQDDSLIDPVDTSNRNGIGADRLKLTPELVSLDRADIDPTDDFFPIIEFGKDSVPVKQNVDPAYAVLGDKMAQEQLETHGDFTVKPFIVGSTSVANTEQFAYTVDPGIAYVKGNRVQLVGAINIDVPRATQLGHNNSNLVTMNYGNYVIINESRGIFNADKLVTIDIYDAPQTAITSSRPLTTPTGTKIGTANVRAVVYNNGTKGVAAASYKLYITNITLNSGKSFANDAKSFHVTAAINGTQGAMGDIVLEGGKASIKDSGISGLIFDTGVQGTRRLRDGQGVNDTQFTFRDISTATLQANGSVTFTLNTPYAGGAERFFASAGVLSAANKLRLDIATTANFANSSANTVAGTVLNLSNSTVTVVSNTQFIIDLGYTITSGAPQTLVASYPVIRTEAVEIKKEVLKGINVKIDTANNTATNVGPFNLGVVDTYAVEAVYVGDSYSTNNPDRKGWFALDNGQQQTHYDHAKLILKPEYQGKLPANAKLLVKLSAFRANTATGIGFFSADSYPTRAPGVVANTTNISYEDIPEVFGFNLRNAVDFRPQKVSTANVAATEATATINPAVSNSSFAVSVAGSYIGEPDGSFQADIEYYLPRYDLIQVNKDGIFTAKSSVASERPVVPIVDNDAMALATSFVPPYPGVANDESALYLATKPRIKTSLTSTRGYTMKDINSIDKRVSVLEYYQALSMLEQQAKDFTVKDENGLDRFKNGIFADPLKNHLLGDVSNFEYNIAIDEQMQIARPKIEKNNVDLDLYANTNISTNGRIASLAYTRELLIDQSYASKFRNVTESVWNWTGAMSLFPEYDHYQDEQSLPAVNVDVDLASPWEEFANSPFAQSYGDWRVASTSQTSSSSATSTTSGRTTTTTTTTATTTTNVLQQEVQQLNVSSSQTKNDLGSYITDITLNPYMRARQVAFIATGLRPSTRIYAFFDGIAVSNNCAPGALNQTIYNQATGEFKITSGKEDAVVTRTGAFGAPMTTDASGNLYGVFAIPDQKFRVGDRVLRLVDVDSLETGADAILTSAKATYTASSLTTTSRNVSITTTNPTLSTTTSTNTVVDSSTSVSQRVDSVTTNVVVQNVPNINTSRGGDGGGRGGGNAGDPLGQSFYIQAPSNIPGIFLDALGVFFRSKDATMGITCYITEMNAGVPDVSRVIATSYLKPSSINLSTDSSAETVFKFNDIPYLANDKSYAFFLKPDADSPNYQVWMSELGGTDILTGNKIFTNPYIGVAFKSANSETWDNLTTEDIKFRAYRAEFQTSGSLTFSEQDDEYLTTDGFAFANASLNLQVGDVVYTQNSSGGVITGNTAPFGIIQEFDRIADTLTLDSSTGGFAANTKLAIYRPNDPTNPASISANNLIATSTVVSVDNIEYSIVVPRIGTVNPTGTAITFSYKGTDVNEIVDANWNSLQPETELEFIDKVRVIKSKSNRTAVDKCSFIKLDLASMSSYISPIVDLRRRSLFAIDNVINADLSNEHTRYGKALSKYISRPITLAEGQDAEDVKILITAYRPADTGIHAYIKILCADDSSNFVDKNWTKLDLVEGASVRSSSIDVNDYREFGFSFPTAEARQGDAWRNLSNNGIVQYRNAAGTIFVGYKTFAIKLVLTSTQKQRVPRIDDVRGICLQI